MRGLGANPHQLLAAAHPQLPVSYQGLRPTEGRPGALGAVIRRRRSKSLCSVSHISAVSLGFISGNHRKGWVAGTSWTIGRYGRYSWTQVALGREQRSREFG